VVGHDGRERQAEFYAVSAPTGCCIFRWKYSS